MKIKLAKTLFFSSALLLGGLTQANAQDVHIPDANFKAALLAIPGIDTNEDGEIQESEAAAYTGQINVSGKEISDLTGIEYFTSTTTLKCQNNQLTNINISNNTKLTILECDNNQLTSLDVSKNTSLSKLNCSSNQLTNLDISNNTDLTELYCGNNQLTNLDVSNNTSLDMLICYDNQLTNLDVSKNTNLWVLSIEKNQLTNLDISNIPNLLMLICSDNKLTSLNIQNNNLNSHDFKGNPDLTCIQVDDVAYAQEVFIEKDAQASYSTDCNPTTAINAKLSIAPKIYPNPATHLVHIDTQEEILAKEIYGLNGFLFQQENNSSNTLDVSNIPVGVYFIKLQTKHSVYEQKFVKK
jgi:hypothetical protein